MFNIGFTHMYIKKPEGLSDYESTWSAMKSFTEQRDRSEPDQLWLVEHAPVYTLGQAGKPEHILNPGNIPVVRSNRGGQVTYHGPGQLVAYALIDLRRANMYVKDYVFALEEIVLSVLAQLGVKGACRKEGAPGVYVPYPAQDLAKIAALGVKITNGCTYHGLAINVDMDLQPFLGINPCGYEGLRTIDLKTLNINTSVQAVSALVQAEFIQRFQAINTN